MDVEIKTIKLLFSNLDLAFEKLMHNPDSESLIIAYQHAKNDLDNLLSNIRSSLEQKYKAN